MENIIEKSNISNNNRLKYIDLLKGFGVVMVVIGHMHYSENVDKLIYGFHMPLFFFISGYLYHTPDNVFVYIKRKFRTLLIPYFIVGIIYTLIDCFIKGSKVLRDDMLGGYFLELIFHSH